MPVIISALPGRAMTSGSPAAWKRWQVCIRAVTRGNCDEGLGPGRVPTRPEFRIGAATAVVLVGWPMLAGCAANAPVSKQAEPEPVRPPEQARELSRQGMLAHQQGQTSVAIEALQKAVALDPTDAAAANNLALLLKQQNRFEEAAGVLRTAIQGSPDVADLHYNLAVISEIYLLDLSAALNHYQRYTELAAEEDKAVTGWMADLQRRLQ